MNTDKIQKLYSDEIKSLGKKDFLKVIRWKLSKYLGHEWSGMDGLMIMPSKNLTQGLTENFVIEELNKQNCFDFDYIPNEGDNLIFEIGWLFNKRGKKIERELEYEYSSYIFKANKWKADSYNPFYEKTEIINEGILKNIWE
ncbi:hypothetical protein [uncultured Tenacibaculum sp.]|uniref:hypothetical protein n=1 Tax=uncultured Tenacibaculum sp. TaxID=174713 RepID=UPI0026020D4D|nr:hypothetical protein [uncultured Tenacibaculum sp.]